MDFSSPQGKQCFVKGGAYRKARPAAPTHPPRPASSHALSLWSLSCPLGSPLFHTRSPLPANKGSGTWGITGLARWNYVAIESKSHGHIFWEAFPNKPDPNISVCLGQLHKFVLYEPPLLEPECLPHCWSADQRRPRQTRARRGVSCGIWHQEMNLSSRRLNNVPGTEKGTVNNQWARASLSCHGFYQPASWSISGYFHETIFLPWSLFMATLPLRS